ncbi:MAG: ribonuclease R [Deltaproteobacteria bacterium]|nr:ribonuclease R [Deltaproteobacteria bacterium]
MDDSQILTFFLNNPKHAWSAREMASRLKMPAVARKELRQKLKRLAAAGKITVHRGGGYTGTASIPTVTGTLKVHYEGYGFLLPDTTTGAVDSAHPDVFIPARAMNYALQGDHVLASCLKEKEGHRLEGKVLQILKRGRTHWIGRLERRGKGYVVINEEKMAAVEIVIPLKDLKGGRVGQTVVAKITRYPGPGQLMTGEIAEVLGTPRDEKTETLAILVKHDIRREFPSKVMEEVNRLPDFIGDESLSNRIDLRNKPILTIDGINARDFDDAVFVEKKGASYHLYVSIADVAHYVAAGHAVDREACQRGTSVYFPDFAVPMLPSSLSNGLCSLKPGEDRLTLTCEIRFDEQGKALEAWYYESVIKSVKRGVYEEIQSVFDGALFSEEAYSPPLRKNLEEMKALAGALLQQRALRGAIEFDLPEAEVRYDKEGKITAIKKAERFFSHRLIEEFMIAANVAVAELFSRHQYPALYRVHDSPEAGHAQEFLEFMRNIGVKPATIHLRQPRDFARLLEGIKNHPMEAVIHQVLLRSMKIAIYDPNNRGHFGLNLRNYCHFTSPIRRYPDLVVHRQLKHWLKGTKADARLAAGKLHLLFTHAAPQHGRLPLMPLYGLADLEYFGELSSRRERGAMEAEREMINYKRAVFMENRVGERFFGTIRRVTKFGLFVELEPYFVEGLLHVSDLTDAYYLFDDKRMCLVARGKKRKAYSVGDKIWVCVKDVSIENRQITLEMA